MPANRKTPWLICYDVADPRRLQAVYNALRRHAAPFQHSVFRATATRREVVRWMNALAEIVDPRQDDVRAYPLLTTSAPLVYGRDLLAEGVQFDLRHGLFANSFDASAADPAKQRPSAQGDSQLVENTLDFDPSLLEH